MTEPLPCNHCGETCGQIFTYPNNDSPPEAKPWKPNLVDAEGFCYCSQECMNAEADAKAEEFADAEEVCFHCGEPLEDGLCSASCEGSAADEGRDVD